MNQIDFLNGQAKIYEKFKNNEAGVRKGGLKKDPALARCIGAHNIVGIYTNDTLEQVERLSRKISLTTPAVLYGPKNAHISFIAMTQDNFGSPDMDIIAKMILATKKALKVFRGKKCGIDFRSPLFNEFCVMLEGIPVDNTFSELASTITEECQKENLPIKMPWGCHSTIARFTANKPPEKLSDFFQLIEGTRRVVPFAQTQIEAIGVGWCTASVENGFHLFIEKIFSLSPKN